MSAVPVSCGWLAWAWNAVAPGVQAGGQRQQQRAHGQLVQTGVSEDGGLEFVGAALRLGGVFQE
jgi:hypothetical protein